MSAKAPQQSEYYVVCLIKTAQGSADGPALFLNGEGKVDCFSAARRFDSIEEAESWLVTQTSLRDEVIIQRCTPMPRHSSNTDTAPYRQLMDLELPYRRTAYNWLRGKPVKSLLMQQGEDVYQRHRRYLLDYDMDIEKPSDIVLLKPRKGKIHINTGQQTGYGPKQFFAYPDQRPDKNNEN